MKNFVKLLPRGLKLLLFLSILSLFLSFSNFVSGSKVIVFGVELAQNSAKFLALAQILVEFVWIYSLIKKYFLGWKFYFSYHILMLVLGISSFVWSYFQFQNLYHWTDELVAGITLALTTSVGVVLLSILYKSKNYFQK